MSQHFRQDHLRRSALRMLLLSTSLWALSFPLMKAMTLAQQRVLPGAGTWFLASLCVMLRFLIAGLLLLAASLASLKTLSRREMEQGLWLGFCASSGICLQMDGLAYIAASTSAFLTQLYCILIPLWAAVIRHHPPGWRLLFCCVLVLAGMGLLVNLQPLAIRLGRGELETLAASVLFAAQILCLEHPRYSANRPLCFTTVMLLAMGLFAAPVVLATAPGLTACWHVYNSVPACGLLAALILVCSLIPFLLMNRWQPKIAASEAAMLYCFEPVVVSLLALFLPGWLSGWAGVDYPCEHLTSRLLLGGGLITAANVFLQSRWLEAKPLNA